MQKRTLTLHTFCVWQTLDHQLPYTLSVCNGKWVLMGIYHPGGHFINVWNFKEILSNLAHNILCEVLFLYKFEILRAFFKSFHAISFPAEMAVFTGIVPAENDMDTDKMYMWEVFIMNMVTRKMSNMYKTSNLNYSSTWMMYVVKCNRMKHNAPIESL